MCWLCIDCINMQVFGDKAAMQSSIMTLQKTLDMKTDAWIPMGVPSPPTRPLSYWVNDVDQVRKQSKKVLDHFLGKGQGTGHGTAPFWSKRVPVNSLGESKLILTKAGFHRSKLSLEDLVPWASLANQPWAKGPKKEALKLSLGWKQHLVIVYEVLLCHLGIASECHSTKRNSSLDFMSPTPKKVKPIERLRRDGEMVEKDVSFEVHEGRDQFQIGTMNKKELRFLSQSSDDGLNLVFTQPSPDLYTQPRSEVLTGPGFLSPEELQSVGVYTQPGNGTTSSTAVPGNPSSGLRVVPVLRDWEQFGDLFDSLAQWSPKCRLQLVRIEEDKPSTNSSGIKLVLHDSDICFSASLVSKYKTDVKFLTPGSVLELHASSGSFKQLVIVSLYFFVFTNIASPLFSIIDVHFRKSLSWLVTFHCPALFLVTINLLRTSMWMTSLMAFIKNTSLPLRHML